jgi:hypothetical protein
MGSLCLPSRRPPSCGLSAKPTARMKPYHRGLLQARANGEAKPSGARVSRTGQHATAGRTATSRPMQKTYLQFVHQTEGVPPIPASRPAYAETTRLLHMGKAGNQACTIQCSPTGGPNPVVVARRSSHPSIHRGRGRSAGSPDPRPKIHVRRIPLDEETFF